MTASDEHEPRFLVLAPTGRDADLTVKVLSQAGIEATACRTMDQLCASAHADAAGLLVAEEALTPTTMAKLVDHLGTQPPWSDLAVVLFTGAGVQARVPTPEALAPLGNVTLLERPVRPVALVSMARSILRGRHRQYAARAELDRREEAVHQRDQFLAMLGHELRNPLNAISLAVGLLGRGTDPARVLGMIHRQTRTLERLVDDLLQVSRVTSGKVDLRCERVDVSELVLRTLAGLEGRRGGRTIRVQSASGPVAPCVHGDPVRLEQVVVNLLSNAIKYTPDSGHIDVATEVVGSEVVLRVHDDGVGIPPHVLPHVFDMFVQADEALDRSQGGLGIGLTLVKALVDLHGGQVEATSDGSDRGSTFVVRLPLVVARSGKTLPSSLRADAPSLHILVIEDDPDVRAITREVLVSAGHRVDTAADGQEGVERAVRLRPDVMLVDVGLPILDGYAVAHQARAVLGDAVRMIAVTGYGQPEDIARSEAAGFDHHLTKPIDPDMLERVLQELTAPV